MDRLVRAFANSRRAWSHLVRHERAFRQEVVLLALSLPAAWALSTDWQGFILLVGAVLAILIVEVLNTGIEAACDAITTEPSEQIRLAKDCGSLAVLIACLLAGAVWLLAAAEAAIAFQS